MTSTYTPNKLIEKPSAGDYVNTWATPVNGDWDIVDTALGGTASLSVTSLSGVVALGISDYRPPNIEISGVLSGNINYQIPTGKGGTWSVKNATTGAYTVTISSGGGGTSVVVPQGERAMIVCDGTNVEKSMTVAAAVVPGGNDTEVQFNNSGSFDGSPNLTFDGNNLNVGTDVVAGGNLQATGNLQAAGSLILEGATSGTIEIHAPAVAGTQVYTLPTTDGAASDFLQTDGSGVLTWTALPGTTTNAATFNDSNTGDASPVVFNGSAAKTISANTIGAVALSAFTGTGQSLTTNGFQVLPGGLIINWGFNTGAGNSVAVTFAKPFPTAFLAGVCATNRTSSGSLGTNYINGQSTSGMTCVFDQRSGVSSDYGGWWIAIGY